MIRIGDAEFEERPPADPLELLDLDDDGTWDPVRWPSDWTLGLVLAGTAAAVVGAAYLFGIT